MHRLILWEAAGDIIPASGATIYLVVRRYSTAFYDLYPEAIDDVAVYASGLTLEKIKAHYDAGKAV